jgi:hypothetical protein
MPNTIMQSNRVAPWLGIGTQGKWDNSLDALRAGKLDFEVRQEKLYWEREDKEMPQCFYKEQAPMFANIRNVDNRLLGCVTPQYKIIQNRDAFSLIDPFVQGNNGVITNVGMTEDGLAFMVARVQVERTIGGEPYEINLMVTNSFNTKYPCQIILTPIRIYCQNMYRKLTNDRVFLAKHTIAANDRLIALAQSNIVEKRVLAFSNVIESYQGKHMSARQLDALLAMLFPYPKEGGPREATYILKADEQRQRFKDQYFDAPDNRQHQNTAFGFVNAYFDYLSHRSAIRETSRAWADRRLSGLVSGLDVNQSVLREANGR